MPNEDGKVVFKAEVDTSGLKKDLDNSKTEAEKKGEEVGKKVSEGVKKGTESTPDKFKSISEELDEVNKRLKVDPKNFDLLSQKSTILASGISETKNRLAELNSKQEEMASLLSSGKITGQEYRAYQREVIDAKQAIKDLESQQNDLLKSNQTFGQKLKTNLSSAGTAIKENMGKAIGAVTGAMAVGVGKIAKHGLELASDLSEVQNVVDTTFGKNADKIDAFSKSAGKNFGLSELSAKQYSSTLGAMTKSMGLSGDQVLTLSENLTGLSGDMASFYNLDPAEAFEKIRSGISGETEPLKQLGINMSEANLSAFALSKGIKKPYNEMSQGEQTMLRYNYLMTATKDAQGDFSKTSDSYANQQRLLQMQYDDTAATLGQTLLPIMVKLMNFINGLVTNISGFVKEHPQLAAAIGGIIILLGLVFGGLSLLSTIMPIITALTAASGVAAGGAAVGFGAMLLPIIIVIAAIAALIAITVLIVKNWSGIQKFFVNLWSAIVAAFNQSVDWIKQQWGNITDFFSKVWKDIQRVFANVGDWFKSTFEAAKNGTQSAWNNVSDFFGEVGRKIQDGFGQTIEWIKKNWKSLALFLVNPIAGAASLLYNNNPKFKKWADSVMLSIKNGISNGWNSIIAFFSKIWGAIAGFLTPIINKILGNLTYLWDSVRGGLQTAWNGIQKIGSGLWDFLKNIFLAPVLLLIDLITGNFQKLQEDAAHIWQNILNAAATFRDGVIQLFSGLGEAIKNGAITMLDMLQNAVTNIWNGLVRGAVLTWNAITSFLTTVITNIVNFLVGTWNAIPGFFFWVWNSIISGVVYAWNSITRFFISTFNYLKVLAFSAWNGLWSAASSAMNSIRNTIISAWNGIISFFTYLPGRLYNLGYNIMAGLHNGIISLWGSIYNAVTGALNNAMDWIRSLPSRAYGWGQDIIQGIVNGIRSAVRWVQDAVSNVAANIRSFLHFSVPDKGPLSDFDTYAPDMMKLWAKGIRGDEDLVVNATRRVTGNVANQIYPTGTGAVNSITAAVTQGVPSAPSAPIVVSSPIYLDGKLISDNTTKHQQISAAVRGLTKQ